MNSGINYEIGSCHFGTFLMEIRNDLKVAVSCLLLPYLAEIGCGGWRQEKWHDIENEGDN
jgi:hypothetical protein